VIERFSIDIMKIIVKTGNNSYLFDFKLKIDIKNTKVLVCVYAGACL